jgi:hypothetical protein
VSGIKVKITISSLIGIGGATIISAIAKTLPLTHSYKSWLIFFSPVITILIANIWNSAIKLSTKYLMKHRSWNLERKLDKKVKTFIKNPHISNENKRKVRQEIEQLYLEKINDLTQRIRETNSGR